MDNVRIKPTPCPYCGEAPQLMRSGLKYGYNHICERGNFWTGFFWQEQSAADEWNRVRSKA